MKTIKGRRRMAVLGSTLLCAWTHAACLDRAAVPVPGGDKAGGDSTGGGGGEGATETSTGNTPLLSPETGPGGGGESGEGPGSGCEPGSVTLRRLNRTEYDNTIRDLTGLDLGLARDFPNDDYGYGFDNIGDVLSTSPLLVEKWEAAAETVVEAMLARSGAPRTVTTFEAEEATADVGGAHQENAWNLWSNGSLSAVVALPAPGTYRVRVRAFAQQAGAEPARMSVQADDQTLQVFEVTATGGNYQVYALTASLPAGPTTLRVSFDNDFYVAGMGDRNLIVDWFEIEGPLEPGMDTPARARVMTCSPETTPAGTCAREILGGFAARAWRRPLEASELDRLAHFVDIASAAGDDFEQGIRLGLRAILLSPHFLYRVEIDDAVAVGEVRPLTSYELASRLSYFLWSSMPDAELLARAADGSLREPAVLEAQVRRMIEDERADALVKNFAGQWLFTRGVQDAFPDPVFYPAWDEDLRHALEAETALVFQELLLGERSILDLLDADFTYVNELLAAHYGLPGVTGSEMQRIDLQGHPERGGLFTHGSFLTTTSHPTRTSPVKRGKLILEQLLCISPPPPPPGVEGLPEEVDATASLRERFEQHRQDPNCISCHVLMDPFGFALEHYDGIGAWRETDQGFDIDTSGVYFGTTHFSGPRELAQLMKADPALPECIAQKSLTYALGRGFGEADVCTLSEITSSFAEGGHRLTDLFVAIAKSEAFLQRRRRGETP